MKKLPADAGDAEDSGSIPRWVDPLEKEDTLSSILAWRNSWIEEPGGLPSMGSQSIGDDLATKLPPPPRKHRPQV